MKDLSEPDDTGSSSELIALAAQSAHAIQVERIDTSERVRELVAEISHNTRREVCSMLPGGPYPLTYLRKSWADDLEMINRRVRAMALYQADAVREPGVLHYLSELSAAGAEIRVAVRVTHRTLIVDRCLVVVAMQQDALTAPFLLIREPALVRTFHTSFAQSWRSSHSVGMRPEDDIASDNIGQTIAILQSGVTDEVAARQLNVSVRTVRRRVAAVMELLNASSRFEAGVKAAKAGWI